MPDQTTYRVRCPSCGEWAQLRIAEPISDPDGTPVVVMFSCLNQSSEGHFVPGDDELLKLLPGEVIDWSRNPGYS